MRRIVYTTCAVIAAILLLLVMPGCEACRGFVAGLHRDLSPAPEYDVSAYERRAAARR